MSIYSDDPFPNLVNPTTGTVYNPSSIGYTYRGSCGRTFHAPPDYAATVPNEHDPLIPNLRHNSKSSPCMTTLMVILVLLLVIGSFTGGLFITLPPDDPVVWKRDRLAYQNDRRLWEAQRQDWEQARRNYTEDQRVWQEERVIHDNDRLSWEAERDMMLAKRVAYEIEVESWNKERATWGREKAQWEREKHRHDDNYPDAPPGAYWEEPTPAPQCHSYGKRKYSARLRNIPSGWGWVNACKATPVHIHGTTVMSPDICEDLGIWGGLIGHWIVDFEETGCQPFFAGFYDIGCVTKGSKLRRIEAQIHDIQSGDDWLTMCSTTPTTIRGIYYPGPSHCEARWWGSKVGIWDIHDFNC